MKNNEAYVSAIMNGGFDLAFARLEDPDVIMQVKIPDYEDRSFDENRLFIMYLDGEVALDFCDIKSFAELSGRLDPTPKVRFSFQEKTASGVIWHGIASEGNGVIGKIMDTRSLAIRIYFDDYSFEEFELPPLELDAIKQKIHSEILYGE